MDINQRTLPDGRLLTLLPMENNRAMIGVSDGDGPYEEVWIFAEMEVAVCEFNRWDGTGEPEGCVRYVSPQHFPTE